MSAQLVDFTEISPSMIGDRDDVWDLMFRAAKHMQQQMSAIRLNRDLSGDTHYPVAHGALADAHGLLCGCCNLIVADKYALFRENAELKAKEAK